MLDLPKNGGITISAPFLSKKSRILKPSKQDKKNFEPSRVVLTSKIAKKPLENALKGSAIYKHPGDYFLGKDTFYMKSFNNVMNRFQDKRNFFGDDQYYMRSNLAVCHWNENIDREHTSLYNSNNLNAPETK